MHQWGLSSQLSGLNDGLGVWQVQQNESVSSPVAQETPRPDKLPDRVNQASVTSDQ